MSPVGGVRGGALGFGAERGRERVLRLILTGALARRLVLLEFALEIPGEPLELLALFRGRVFEQFACLLAELASALLVLLGVVALVACAVDRVAELLESSPTLLVGGGEVRGWLLPWVLLLLLLLLTGGLLLIRSLLVLLLCNLVGCLLRLLRGSS